MKRQGTAGIVSAALAEDVGPGDITSEFFVAATRRAEARIVARERAVVAGTAVAEEVFRQADPGLAVRITAGEGTVVEAGGVVLEITGAARSILTAERVALNFLQRLSGIATLTRQYVDAVGGHPAQILDTRKTTPGLRPLEKAAVVAGGGVNHRHGLHDMALVKDNHLAAGATAGILAETIQRLREAHPDVRVEVEADELRQVREFLKVKGIDVILLDNMKPAQLRRAIAMGRGRVKFEASGGVTLKTVQRIAATGVDYISVGALTHSARAIDFSLELTHAAD